MDFYKCSLRPTISFFGTHLAPLPLLTCHWSLSENVKLSFFCEQVLFSSDLKTVCRVEPRVRASIFENTMSSALSYLGLSTQNLLRQPCTCRLDEEQDQLHLISRPLCPFAYSMNYIAKTLASKASSTTSSESLSSAHSLSLPSSTPATPLDDLVDDDAPRSKADEPLSTNKRKTIPFSKNRTVLRLAYPPPTLRPRQRLHIRNKVLLQLQHVYEAERPVPVLEVLPSAVFAPKLGRFFWGMKGRGIDDLVVVRSQDYKVAAGDGDAVDYAVDDDWSSREILAAICSRGQNEGQAIEISLKDGSTWGASRLGNGIYEFVTIDEQGHRIVARWVPKHSRQSTEDSLPPEHRFNFSLLDSRTRRHAVIGVLTPQYIRIRDQYFPPPPLGRSESTGSKSQSSAMKDDTFHLAEADLVNVTAVEVDESLRILITITGIWVALREGYSPTFHFEHTEASQASVGSTQSRHNHRSLSLNITELNSYRYSLDEPKRTLVSDLHTARHTSIQGATSPSHGSTSFNEGLPGQLRRTLSTGTASIQRFKDRRLSATGSRHLSPIESIDGSDAECNGSRSATNPSEKMDDGPRGWRSRIRPSSYGGENGMPRFDKDANSSPAGEKRRGRSNMFESQRRSTGSF